ncbi:hypothetical protein SBOR_0164 [Sclerotinia borealis F-4128]|uniref:Uncharacterized protein n=1 Tax=Sclerotinia borealis (strain F-4128) TaxID=1432307 RepID=W9CRI5_SCLBF|nr:hypothetical protein SBOR_0164 [Sclerotinia borealis F-4128]
MVSTTQTTKTHRPDRAARAAARRARNTSTIPMHEFLHYTPDSGKLSITLDFATSRSPFHQTTLEKSLINTLPMYAIDASNINLEMTFKIPHMDVSTKNNVRHQVLTNVVKELNKFKHFDSLHFVLAIERYSFDQLKPASAIYGLDYTDWTFEVREWGTVTQVKIGSGLDRQLKARFQLGNGIMRGSEVENGEQWDWTGWMANHIWAWSLFVSLLWSFSEIRSF